MLYDQNRQKRASNINVSENNKKKKIRSLQYFFQLS